MGEQKLVNLAKTKPRQLQEAERQKQTPDAQNILSPQHNPVTGVSCHCNTSGILNRTTISPHSLLQLQRQYGNRYVQRVLALSRQGEGETDVAPEVERAIEQKRGGGQTLDSKVRVQMESAFGVNFSGVRVHTDSEAHTLNQVLSARAFTTGQDIFFSQGEYNPGSSSGKELLAHELTHVVQQTGGVQTKLVVGEPGDVYEQEADQAARTVMQHGQQAAPKESQEGLMHWHTSMEEEPVQTKVQVASVQLQAEEGQATSADQGSQKVSALPEVSAGASPPVPSSPIQQEEGAVQTKLASPLQGLIQRQGGPIEATIAAGAVLQEAAAGFEILRSVITPMTQGEIQVTWPNSPIGVTWPAKPAELHLNATTQSALIVNEVWSSPVGIEQVNAKLRCHVQYDGPQVQATFSFDAEGRRSRLNNDTYITVNNPLSLETRRASPEWQRVGIREYPVVRIPIEVRIDRIWPQSNYNLTFNLVLSGMYGFGAAVGENGIQDKRVAWT